MLDVCSSYHVGADALMTLRLMSEEYRVLTSYKVNNRVVVAVRQEGPWDNYQDAANFAAKFTSPKFEKAWVEGRIVTHWGQIS